MAGVIASCRACMPEVVGRYHGMIARHMGEGVFAYICYSHAQRTTPSSRCAPRSLVRRCESPAGSRRRVARRHCDRHRHRGGARADRHWRRAESRGAPASAGGAGGGVDLPAHPPAGGSALLLPRPRRGRAARPGGAGLRLAGAGAARIGELRLTHFPAALIRLPMRHPRA